MSRVWPLHQCKNWTPHRRSVVLLYELLPPLSGKEEGMKHLAIVGAVTVGILLAASARAESNLMEYIDWIVGNSDLTYDGQPLPELVELPYALLEIEVYGPDAVAQCEYQGCKLTNVRGAYFHDRNQMAVPDGFVLEDNEDVIVHELYHFLQYLGDVPECHQLLEKPAYKAHWEWVKAHGLEEKYEEPSWLFVYMLEMPCSASPYDYQ